MAPALTPAQVAIVKSTAPALKEHGVDITALFYSNMLKAHPELNDIFSEVSQTTRRQPRALAASVVAYATYIDDLGKLGPAVERIAHKHVSLGVTADQYAIVGKHLIEAVATVLGPAVTPEVAEAWTAAYAQLADIFIVREGQLYDGFAKDNWTGWRKFRIQRKVPESSLITSFYLVPEDGKPLPLHKPGQYISLHMEIPEMGHLQPRQYSLSEAPRSDYYRLSIKKELGREPGIPGLISNRLHERYNEGDIIELTHPTGEFFVDPEAPAHNKDSTAPLALISAGVGVTPMVSILNHTVASGSKRPVAWVHGAHSADVRAFHPHVRDAVAKNPNIDPALFLSDVKSSKAPAVAGVDYHHEGRVDLDKVGADRLCLANPAAEYYVCGPFGFMTDVRDYLVGKGVDASRVHMEVFGTGDE